MIGRGRHLRDDRLFDCYLAQRTREPLDPRSAEHLADCGDCAARYADMVTLMDGFRTEADAETDRVFTPERLRAQQQQVMRRIEQVGRSARVISFPGRSDRSTISSSPTRTAPRWVAAAAAAGLFVGIGLGASYEYGSRVHIVQQVAARPSAPTHFAPIATRGSGKPEIAADDAFLTDLELALERPHTRELVAFDALTPHVREVRDR